MCSLLPDSLKAKEAGGAPLGFQLLKLKRKVKQEVVEQVWQYTVGVLNIWESETYALVKCD